MDSSIKQKWITALRSGTYKKGNKNLRTQSGYSALGVLIDVIMKGKIKPYYNYHWEWVKVARYYRFKSLNSSFELGVLFMPHYALLVQLNISVSDANQLVKMSDSVNHTFDSIANWIETNL